MRETAEERAAGLKGLRDLADFLEQHPDVPMPYRETFNIFFSEKSDLQAVVKGTGKWEKLPDGNYFVCRKTFGFVNFELNVAREKVCERVVVGTEIVPAMPERTIEKVEWKCKPLFETDIEV